MTGSRLCGARRAPNRRLGATKAWWLLGRVDDLTGCQKRGVHGDRVHGGAGGTAVRAPELLRRASSTRRPWPRSPPATASARSTRRVWKQMCADGWAGIGWPTAWGGQGRSAIEQFIFFDESMRAGAPVPMLTINTVGPTIMNFGSDEQTLVLPPEDPRRRHPLLHRLLRARGRHRPRRAPDARCPRRR